MKKVLAFVSSLLLLASAVFADVSVKKLDDGNVEVTFFYANPRAGEVLLAGDFTNWADGALAMEKTEKGFTLTQTVAAGTVMKYKFISDGNWTEDLREPDKIDDGFGGFNGLVDVDELVAAASSGAAADGAAPAKKPSIKFQTWSMVGLQNGWDINSEGGLDEKNAGLGAKSYWKFSGDVAPNVPFYVEVAVAENDGFKNIYDGDKDAVKDNVSKLGVDLLTCPIYALNGDGDADKTYLGHFKAGVNTGYVDFLAGYKYAKLPPHSNVNWTTLDDSWDAGYSAKGGWAQFALGNNVKEAVNNATNGNVSGLQVVVGPNKSADRAGGRYGLYAYVDATLFGSNYVDFQFNAAYGENYDTLFKTGMENDFILGYSGKFGPVAIKANGLMNLYGSNEIAAGKKTYYVPGSSDVGPVSDTEDAINNMAANVNVAFESDFVNATLGYRFRGLQANLMYVKQADGDKHISDALGGLNSQKIWGSLEVLPNDWLTIKVEPSAEMTFNKDRKAIGADKDNIKIEIKPTVSAYLGDITSIDGEVSAYAKMKLVTEDADKFATAGADASKFGLREAGLHFGADFDSALSSLDAYYGYDADDANLAMHSLILDMGLPAGINAQIGGGFRTSGNNSLDNKNALGFFVGANKVINNKYKTILYTNFVYGMNPYKGFGDGGEVLNLSNSTIDSGIDNYQQQAAVNLAVRFDF